MSSQGNEGAKTNTLLTGRIKSSVYIKKKAMNEGGERQITKPWRSPRFASRLSEIQDAEIKKGGKARDHKRGR